MLAALAAAGMFLFPASAASLNRYPVDMHDIEKLRAIDPKLVDELEQAEGLLQQGRAEEAATILSDAGKKAPRSALLARRECQALRRLGHATSATEACQRAMRFVTPSAMDYRALVSAMLSGEELPSPTDVTFISDYAKRAREAMPVAPYGLASVCDMADRFRHLGVLDYCVSELRVYAPRHPETVHYERALAQLRARWKTWVLLGALAAACLLTVLHAAGTWVGRLARIGGASALMVLATVGLAHANPLKGDPGRFSDWEIREDDPESKLPTLNQRDEDPVQFGHYLVDLSFKAEQAQKKGDHHKAVKFFRAITKVVPESAVGFGKVCAEYETLEEWQNAIDYCRAALGREGVVLADYQRFVRLLLEKKPSLTQTDIEDVVEIVKHLKPEADMSVAAARMQCDLGLKIKDSSMLTECTSILAAQFPEDPVVVSYQWALAVQNGDMAEASRLLDRARALSLSGESIQKMELAMKASGSSWVRILRKRLWLIVILITGITGGVVAALFARRRSENRAAQV